MLPEQTRRDIGDRVRELRISQRLTQAGFSEVIDISINFLSEIENGKKGLSCETLYNICVNFPVSADYILFGKSETEHGYDKIIEIAQCLSDKKLSILIEYLTALQKLKKIDEADS